MKGVTIATFTFYLGRQATKDELRKITDAQIADIYQRLYWEPSGGDMLPVGMDVAVFDAAVNVGPARAIRWVQQIVGATPDGAMGRQTANAVMNYAKTNGVRAMIEAFNAKRQGYYESLPTFATFGKGWTRRTHEVGEFALASLKGSTFA